MDVASCESEGTGEGWVAQVIDGWIGRHQPDLVAVDAPSGTGCDPRGKSGRLCEQLTTEYVDECWRRANREISATELAHFGIARTPRAESEGVPGWMKTGFATYSALATQGYPVAEAASSLASGRHAAIEVYPDASFWLLAAPSREHLSVQGGRAPLARKRHAPAALVAGDRLHLLPAELRRCLEDHPIFPASASTQIHHIDAACAALTGDMAARGDARCLSGRAGEGAIWLPEWSAIRQSVGLPTAPSANPTWVPDGAITSDPGVLLGKPTVRGTRISVAFVLEQLAGTTKREILRDYPLLTSADIEYALRYAARIMHEERRIREVGAGARSR